MLFINKNKKIFFWCFLFFLAICIFLPISNQAWSAEPPAIDKGFNYVDNGDLGISNADVSDPRVMAVNIVKFFLSFFAIIAVAVIMWAGFLWMTSEGDPAKVDRAKKTLINAVIGMAVIISSFAIVLFVEKLITDGLDSFPSGPGAGSSPDTGLGATGNKAIESHYPERGQINVPRNTKVVATFKEPIDASTIIYDTNGNGILGDWLDGNDNLKLDSGEYDRVLKDNFKIAKKDDILDDNIEGFEDWHAAVSADNKTFSLTQEEPYFGSPSEDVEYSVWLTKNIIKANGDPVWSGLDEGYIWSFKTGTEIDTTPPRIKSIVPAPLSEEPRNVVVQMNFNEAIDPVSVGADPAYNIDVKDNGSLVPGIFYISNIYSTLEFLTEDDCGTNSCGQTVYCLPASADMSVLIKAAGTGLNNGIADMAGNSFDGNSNGVSQGPGSESGLPPFNANDPDPEEQGDDYIWTFKTTGEVDLTAPKIIAVTPGAGASGVSFNEAPAAVFDKLLMKSSVTKNDPPGTGSASLYADPEANEVPFWFYIENDAGSGEATIEIRHQAFMEDTSYTPEFNSGIRDIYQNCYYPDGTGGGGPDCTPNPPAEPYCCSGSLSSVSCE